MRFPYGLDAAYRQHESDERLKRVLALDVRYGNCGEPAHAVEHIGGDWSPAQVCRRSAP